MNHILIWDIQDDKRSNDGADTDRHNAIVPIDNWEYLIENCIAFNAIENSVWLGFQKIK